MEPLPLQPETVEEFRPGRILDADDVGSFGRPERRRIVIGPGDVHVWAGQLLFNFDIGNLPHPQRKM